MSQCTMCSYTSNGERYKMCDDCWAAEHLGTLGPDLDKAKAQILESIARHAPSTPEPEAQALAGNLAQCLSELGR